MTDEQLDRLTRDEWLEMDRNAKTMNSIASTVTDELVRLRDRLHRWQQAKIIEAVKPKQTRKTVKP